MLKKKKKKEEAVVVLISFKAEIDALLATRCFLVLLTKYQPKRHVGRELHEFINYYTLHINHTGLEVQEIETYRQLRA